MKAVFKYQLYPGVTECVTGVTALPLTVQTQDDEPHIWMLVDPLEETAIKRFRIYGTGHSISDPNRIRYVGTCQQASGFVWHVFEDSTPSGKVNDSTKGD
jgi:hypothetical protein